MAPPLAGIRVVELAGLAPGEFTDSASEVNNTNLQRQAPSPASSSLTMAPPSSESTAPNRPKHPQLPTNSPATKPPSP